MRSVSFVVMLLLIGCEQSVGPEIQHQEIAEFRTQLSEVLLAEGPTGWLAYFEDSESFFMGSDGRIVFPSSDSADVFVTGLSTSIKSVSLEWLEPRVEIHSADLVTLASPYWEEITDNDGQVVEFGGLVTMLLIRSDDQWRIRNLHWSSPVSPTSEQ